MNFGENLLRFNRTQIFMGFDFETCSLALSDTKNVVWEIAYQVHTLDKVIAEKEYLIKWPEIPISPEAAMMTNFYQKEAKLHAVGANPLKVLEEFDKYLYDPAIISYAHNGLGFDALIHNLWRKKLGKATNYSYINRFIDTNCIAKAWKLGATFPTDRKDLTAFQYKMLNFRQKGLKTGLKTLAPDLGLVYDQFRHHEAMYDVSLMKDCFKQLIYKVEI